MRLLCRLGFHRAADDGRWNDGRFFSTCLGCGRDLIRRGHESWVAVPKGFRVRWRPREPWQIDWEAWQKDEVRRSLGAALEIPDEMERRKVSSG